MATTLGLFPKRILGRIDIVCSNVSRCFSNISIRKFSYLLPELTTIGESNKSSQRKCIASRTAIVTYQQPSRQMSMLDVFRRKKKKEASVDDDEDEPLPGQIFEIVEERKVLTEEEIQNKRNISRLGEHHRRLVHGEIPYPQPTEWFHHTIAFKRKMYGKYGESSGVDPRLCWPTKNELENRLEYEAVAMPFTIQEMVKTKQAMRNAEKEEFERREAEVDKGMQMVEKFKEDLFAKQRAKENELQAATQRREKLMEEVRRHFGYTVDPKDERFQELLAKKEKEQRKVMKETRKLDKERRVLEKIQNKEEPSDKKQAKESKKAELDDD